MWLILVPIVIGLLAGITALITGQPINIPSWVWWVGGIVGFLVLIVNLCHKADDNEEGRYHEAQQALCNQRQSIIVNAMMRKGNGMTPTEQARYDSLVAQSEYLSQHGLPKSGQTRAALNPKRAR